jgi:hypothetical protein
MKTSTHNCFHKCFRSWILARTRNGSTLKAMEANKKCWYVVQLRDTNFRNFWVAPHTSYSAIFQWQSMTQQLPITTLTLYEAYFMNSVFWNAVMQPCKRLLPFWRNLKMMTVHSYETSINIYQTMWCLIAGKNIHCHRSLKYHILTWILELLSGVACSS